MRNGWIAAAVFASMPIAELRAGDNNSVVNLIKLDLQLSGIGSEGCTIEIKPAHAGCKFDPIKHEVAAGSSSGVLRLDTMTIEAKALNADRTCAFAITVTEPKAKPQVFKRSVRLNVAKAGEPTPEVAQTFYLRTTAVAKRDTP
jgi:hypothetical protein